MRTLEITEADYSNSKHAEAVLEVTDRYARDPMGSEEPLSPKVREKLIDEMKNFPCSFSIIAFVDDKPAGVANCVYSFSTFKAARIINIHDLAVMPDFRGQGIGEALLATVEKKAEKEKCCKITLEVREDNRARSLYERFGFSYGNPRMFFMDKELD